MNSTRKCNTIVKVQAARDALDALAPDKFDKPNDQNHLIMKLGLVLDDFNTAKYDQALTILERDIINTKQTMCFRCVQSVAIYLTEYEKF